VGAADPIKGQAVKCLIALKQPERFSTDAARASIVKEIEAIVEQALGAFARPAFIGIVAQLPKTRSGKIMRRTILAVLEGRDPGDVTTLDDSSSIEAIHGAVAQTRECQAAESAAGIKPPENNR
jgi:propionyl-CoA synthetase